MGLSEIKRNQILDAATSVFQQYGYQACSMDNLAENAGVSKRTVYNHFENKEELFLAVIDHVVGSLKPVVRVAFNPERPVREQLIDIVHAEIELMQSKSGLQFFRMLLGELLRNPDLFKMIKNRQPSCETEFDTWLNNAISHGTLEIPDTSLAKDQLFGLLKSAAFWPSIMERTSLSNTQKEAIAESTVSMFLNSYGCN